MKIAEKIPLLLSKGAFIIMVGSALVGGHMTASYLLLKPKPETLSWYIGATAAIILINIVYFLVCNLSALFLRKGRPLLLKCTFAMLLNIPIAITYFLILLSYER